MIVYCVNKHSDRCSTDMSHLLWYLMCGLSLSLFEAGLLMCIVCIVCLLQRLSQMLKGLTKQTGAYYSCP